MLQCEGVCDLWRLLYSKRKLTLPEKQQLQTISQDVSSKQPHVHVLEHNCYNPVEPLYYKARFNPIYVCCASDDVQDSGVSE